MSIQRTFGKHASLAAAATLALGLATAGAAHAEQGQRASAAVADDTLAVVGTNHADRTRLALAADDPTTLLVDLGNGAGPQPFAHSPFSAITVSLNEGDDQFVAGTGFADEAMTVSGGLGTDAIVG